MSEFKQEQRYAVFKLSDMDGEQMKWLSECIVRLPRRECVVVESDWPEYEPVWRMIENRVAGHSVEPSMKTIMQALSKVRGAPVLTSNQCADLADQLRAVLAQEAGKVEPVAFPGYPPVPEDRKLPVSPPAPVSHKKVLEVLRDETEIKDLQRVATLICVAIEASQ